MRHAGLGPMGRLAICLGSLFAPPYKGRHYLAHLTDRSYVSPSASIHHKHLQLEGNVFIGDHVTVYGGEGGGLVKLGKGVHIQRDCIIETGQGGKLTIGEDTHIQPRCHFSAYKGAIEIGRWVQIAPNCSFYPYNHSFKSGELIKKQVINTKRGIVIGDDAWLGVGVIVLDGAIIGTGAVIGAGSVVESEIPNGAIAVGAPAKVIKYREKPA